MPYEFNPGQKFSAEEAKMYITATAAAFAKFEDYEMRLDKMLESGGNKFAIDVNLPVVDHNDVLNEEVFEAPLNRPMLASEFYGAMHNLVALNKKYDNAIETVDITRLNARWSSDCTSTLQGILSDFNVLQKTENGVSLIASPEVLHAKDDIEWAASANVVNDIKEMILSGNSARPIQESEQVSI